MNIEKIVCIDFDKTICDSDYPEIRAPKDGVKKAIERIRAAGYYVIISSCRTCKYFPEVFNPDGAPLDMNRPGVIAMIEFLKKHEIPYDEIDDGEKGKVYAAYYIDDKALRFQDNWSALADYIEGKRLLPTQAAERKKFPLWSGLMKYFPDALVAISNLSFVGNQQHNAGKPLHWSREKSSDHEDTLLRHLMESGTVDIDGVPHSVKVAWRALAIAQLDLERMKS